MSCLTFSPGCVNLVLLEFPLLILKEFIGLVSKSAMRPGGGRGPPGGCRLEGGDDQELLIWRLFCAGLGTGICQKLSD